MSNSNINLSNNENNIKTFVRNGKMYMRLGNKNIYMGPFKPQPSTVKPTIYGPGTYFKNNNEKKKIAINLVKNTIQSQLNKSKNLIVLKPAYAYSLLRKVGQSTYKNYVALSNSGLIHGFAVIYNSPNKPTTRNIEVIATVPGRGIGRNLINKIKQNAKLNGKNKISLQAVQSAVQFYNKLGFTRSGPGTNLVPMNLNI